MGASAHEIERQIGETRERMDANLTRLEGQTRSRAMRYGRFAAVGLAAALVAGIAFFVYRRTHRPSLADRVVSRARGVRDLKLKDLNLKDRLPTVTLRINEREDEEPGTVESIVRKVAPALAGTAGTALLQRLAAESDEPGE